MVLLAGGGDGGAPGVTVLRSATPADAAAIAEIYNQGIEDRLATYETEPRTATQVPEHLEGTGNQVALVAVRGARVVGFAWTSPYRARACSASARLAASGSWSRGSSPRTPPAVCSAAPSASARSASTAATHSSTGCGATA